MCPRRVTHSPQSRWREKNLSSCKCIIPCESVVDCRKERKLLINIPEKTTTVQPKCMCIRLSKENKTASWTHYLIGNTVSKIRERMRQTCSIPLSASKRVCAACFLSHLSSSSLELLLWANQGVGKLQIRQLYDRGECHKPQKAERGSGGSWWVIAPHTYT